MEHERLATVFEIERGLPSVLLRLLADGDRWILIVEPVHEWGYVQFMCYEDGSVYAETMSNDYMDDAHRLSDDQEAALLDLGWDPPQSPAPSNFSRTEVHPDPLALAALAVGTVRGPHGLGPRDVVRIKLFRSSASGHTPAEVFAPLTDAPACPACGANGIPVVYGHPTPGLNAASERGDVVLAGCPSCDTAEMPSGRPWSCGTCGHEWAQPR